MSGNNIQPAPPTYNTTTGNMNEKHEYTHVAPDTQNPYPQQPQQTYQAGTPQQSFHQTGPQESFHPDQQKAYQQGAPQQSFPQQANASRNNYQMATPLASLQQGPAPVDCPICGVREMTRTEYVSGGTTHLSAILCCCCLCLGCIPYLASWFKDCEHKCGHCGGLLAVWHRSGRTEVMAHGRS